MIATRVLRGLSGHLNGWRDRTDSVAGAKSEPEFICGEVGPIGESGMLVEVDLVRRRLITARRNGIHCALSRGEEPSRQRERSPVPSRDRGQQKPRNQVRCRDHLGGLLKYYSYAA